MTRQAPLATDRGLARSLPLTAGAVAVTAAVGSALTDPDSAWYRRLDLPSWQPPGRAFPLVWTPLYASIAVSSALVADRARAAGDEAGRAAYLRALGVNLLLNAGWSATFFAARRPGAAVAVAAGLAVSSADLARRAGRFGSAPRAMLIPYAAWTGFATVLSASIWSRNRGRRTR